ncbi:hypothetical protein Bca52824_060438 [Brassica carinata]|uniref:Zinc knuckle CX2CX4HX4C domain-containing protein n=1 Tax=Brassica carinata TaxID=52824 RepID=A0A8X7QW47_BRACI|nr:hypothetical protein Bca52824_060438 [Brassica carinata]
MSQSSLLIRNGGSSNGDRNATQLEDDIIRIPECDLNDVKERFRLTPLMCFPHPWKEHRCPINLLPARIWNVEGKVCGLNLGNGRFQFDFDKEEDLQMVLNKRPCHFNQWSFAMERWEPFTSENFPNTILSIDADKPLQFERRIGFPSGDIGKVLLSYDGLHRYCFTCNLISHDENTCPLLAPEERELKRKLRQENLENNERARFPIQGSQGFNSRNPLKRARSPTNGSHPSPSVTTRYSKLNREEKRRRSASSSYQPRETRVTDPRARDRKSSSRHENHYTHHGREVWSRLENPPRKKELQGSQRGRTTKHSERNIFRKETSQHRNRSGNYLPPRRTEDERMERSRATFDSQKTITDNRVSLESGEFFETHRSDFDAAMAEEERISRLKSKVIATGPPSPTHKTPQTLNRPTDASQVQRYDQPLLEQEDVILEFEEGLDQALDVPLTELESTEVDNLKMMAENNIDENMIDLDNDDLLGDELLGETPDLVDAEKIEAIFQLSPANVVSKKAASTNKQMERAKTSTYIQEEALASGSGVYVPKGLLKKKAPRYPDIKGARASKKLQGLGGRASPKKKTTLGKRPSSFSSKVPRIEVFPSRFTQEICVPFRFGGVPKPPKKRI